MIREANAADCGAIRRIYNQGIEDRVATLDADPKDEADMRAWFEEHDARYCVLVAEQNAVIFGWASLNKYTHRCAYAGVADLSIYVDRNHRGRGLGGRLLLDLERRAVQSGFHKIVLFALAKNEHGKALYQRAGYREVGVFRDQGILDGVYQDVIAMEKGLTRP